MVRAMGRVEVWRSMIHKGHLTSLRQVGFEAKASGGVLWVGNAFWKGCHSKSFRPSPVLLRALRLGQDPRHYALSASCLFLCPRLRDEGSSSREDVSPAQPCDIERSGGVLLPSESMGLDRSRARSQRRRSAGCIRGILIGPRARGGTMRLTVDSGLGRFH